MRDHPDIALALELLERCRSHWPAVAKESGVSYSWLSKFARGRVENPGANTLHAVIAACSVLIDE